jgi:predicted site-specific integrase-resolvase
MSVKHLNQTELARRWSISPRTLERWRWVGYGPKFLKMGGRCVYRIEDVEAYEGANLRASTADAPCRADASSKK